MPKIIQQLLLRVAFGEREIEDVPDGGDQPLRVHYRQRNQPCTVDEHVHARTRRFLRETSLARAAKSRQCDEAAGGIRQSLAQLIEFLFAPDELGGWSGDVVPRRLPRGANSFVERGRFVRRLDAEFFLQNLFAGFILG